MSAPGLDDRFGKVRDARKGANGSCFHEWEDRHTPFSLFKLDRNSGEAMCKALELAQQSPFGIALTTIGFIWVMDSSGHVWIAVEELALADEVKRRGIPRRRHGQHPASEKKLGHPTLVAGQAARIAGELAIEEISGRYRWVINCSSGRYCYNEKSRPKVAHLVNLMEHFRGFGVSVMPDYDDAK